MFWKCITIKSRFREYIGIWCLLSKMFCFLFSFWCGIPRKWSEVVFKVSYESGITPIVEFSGTLSNLPPFQVTLLFLKWWFSVPNQIWIISYKCVFNVCKNNFCTIFHPFVLVSYLCLTWFIIYSRLNCFFLIHFKLLSREKLHQITKTLET